MSVQSIFSSLGVLGFQEGFVDLLAIVRNRATEPLYLTDVTNDVVPRTLLATSSFRLNVEQSAKVSEKSAGEAVDPSNFLVPPMTITATLEMPLQMPMEGWVDPAFADLYHMARIAYAGTPTLALTKNKQAVSSSATQLSVDNAADFVRITTPFTVTINDAGVNTTSTVTSVNKRTGVFTLSSAVGRNLTINAQIFAPFRADSDIYHERGFTLVSLREGILSNCLIQNLELTFKPGKSIQVQAEIQACRLDRYYQPDIRSQSDDIIRTYSALPPARMVGHTAVNVSSLASPGWSFGMSGATDDPFFRGFSGLDLLPTSIQEFTVKIANSVVPVHALHAIGSEPYRTGYNNQATRERQNSFPFALAVESRMMSGTLTYKAPIEPWALAERLSGFGGVGQNGLRIAADTFQLDMPNVVWSPSTSEGQASAPQTRQVQWNMVSDTYESLPELQYITS